MKLLVISDIHGCPEPLKKVLETAGNFDSIIMCGDYLYHGPRNGVPEGYDPKVTSSILNKFKNQIIGVRGNCDSEVDQMMSEFMIMDSFSNVLTEGRRIFIHHGHLYERDYLKKMLPPGTLIVSGHTHVALIEEEDGFIFFNPGSISIPKCDYGKSYGIIELNGTSVKIQLLSAAGNSVLLEKTF